MAVDTSELRRAFDTAVRCPSLAMCVPLNLTSTSTSTQTSLSSNNSRSLVHVPVQCSQELVVPRLGLNNVQHGHWPAVCPLSR